MYKKLFKKICEGYTTYTEDEKKHIKKLLKKGVLQEQDDTYIINSKYKVGTIQVEKNYVLLLDISNEHKNIKLEFEHLNGAYDGDLVLAKRVFNPRSRVKAKIIDIFQSKKSDILVYVKNKQFHTVKENIKIDYKLPQEFEEGEVLLVDNHSLKISEQIGNINDPKIDEYISLFLYKELIRLEKELEVDAKMDDTNKRVDLTHLDFCTIDPASAKDHDDAIYFDEQNCILYVAIADVSYFVKEGSALDKQAFEKSTSVYLPAKVLPMLPRRLSEDMCSLRENEKRYAYVFEMHLDKEKLSVKKSKLYEAIIESKKKFSYGRIDRVIEGYLDNYSEVEKRIFDYTTPLYELTKAFRAKRLQKGYDFRSVEVRLKLNHKSKLENVEEESSTPSHQLIEECMLLANIEASKKVNTVGIFRIHEEPPFNAISKLIDDVNLLGIKVKLQATVHDTIVHIQQKAKNSVLAAEIDELIIHAQTQAKYSSKNLGHFGLGFDSYSHFTSPIRRYSDLVLHRMLKTKQTPNNIDDICEHISVQERKVDQLVWDFEDRKYARYAADNIGKEFKAVITDNEKGYAKVYHEMTGMKLLLDNFKGQALYTKLRVVIKSADFITKRIVASIKY